MSAPVHPFYAKNKLLLLQSRFIVGFADKRTVFGLDVTINRQLRWRRRQFKPANSIAFCHGRVSEANNRVAVQYQDYFSGVD